MSNYFFIEAAKEHLPILRDIYNYYVLNTTATFHSKPLAIEEMEGLIFYMDSKYKTFVIQTGEKILGYVVLTQHKNRQAYDKTGEVTVYLQQNFIGKGIGSSAIKFIEEYAKGLGFHTLIATICGENVGSINVFIRNGYEKCAHYKQVGSKFGKWLDVVAYQKLLD